MFFDFDFRSEQCVSERRKSMSRRLMADADRFIVCNLQAGPGRSNRAPWFHCEAVKLYGVLLYYLEAMNIFRKQKLFILWWL